MKRWLYILPLLAFTALTAAARETTVSNVDITVRIDRAGAAHITEVWSVDVQKGTEWYLVQGNLGTIEIRDLAVSDETGRSYLVEDAWDTERTIEEKAGRCGLVHKGDGDYEICWGIGSYGRHRFTTSYTLTNFVKGLTDANAFNHQFVADGMSSPPQHVRVVIERMADGDSAQVAFTQRNTGVWAFGFEGDIHVEADGRIVAETRMPLTAERSVIVMARFDSDLFEPTDRRSEAFEVMKRRAFEGSSYEGDDDSRGGQGLKYTFYGLLALLLGGAGVYTFLELIGITSARPVYGVRRVKGWSRDIPLGGDLVAAHYVLDAAAPVWGRSPKHLIEALLLRFIHRGLIHITQQPKDKRPTLSFGDEMPREEAFGNAVEYRLYKIVRAAAGKDRILQPREFSKWAKASDENSIRLYNWTKALKTYGEKTFDRNGGRLRGHFCSRGRKIASSVPEFRNYLNDFSISNERQAREVALWDDYLVFAALFGIADKVEQEFRALSPTYFQQQLTAGYDWRDASTISYDISRRFVDSTSAYKLGQLRAAGVSVVVASLGGGGGHTGGGHGGGAR